MQVTARVDYALRAMAELAAAWDRNVSESVKGAHISESQDIPKKFLENILFDLKRAGLVKTQRGARGGYQLLGKPEEITLADVVRAVEGPLANVRGEWPEDLFYEGVAKALGEVWIAVRASLRAVLEEVTLADLVSGELPESVKELTSSSVAWHHH